MKWSSAEPDVLPPRSAITISDRDRDSLYRLPLGIVPFQTTALTRATMIKTARLESVIELFDDASTGSGQISIEDLPGAFGWTEPASHPDFIVLQKLALLPSFDIYSLRILLRDQGIAVNGHGALRLSQRKNNELTSYMTRFTRPLLTYLYGRSTVAVDAFEDLIALFREPDVQHALSRLKLMAARLGLRVDQVPKFLEDYGDVFLSLSYYRQALDELMPAMGAFRKSIGALRKHWQLRKDPFFNDACVALERTMDVVIGRLQRCFDRFDTSVANLWTDISASHFRKVQGSIAGAHVAIGAGLCGLTVKMDAWSRAFPSPHAGSAAKRANFILTQMRPGFDATMVSAWDPSPPGIQLTGGHPYSPAFASL